MAKKKKTKKAPAKNKRKKKAKANDEDAAAAEETRKSSKTRWMAESREFGRAIGTAVLVAVILRLFVIEPYRIPTGSMLPTLQVGDHIFVNKFTYGLMIPLTTAKILRFGDPRVGDVIVFKYPLNTKENYVKRVVATPGDKVEVIRGELYVNGSKHETADPKKGFVMEQGCQAVRGTEKTEHLNEVTHSVFDTGYTPKDDFGAVTVDPETVFVMGDNRDESLDSREWGFVRYDHIKGKAMFIWWSWNRCKKNCPEGLDCGSTVRWSRLLSGVQ